MTYKSVKIITTDEYTCYVRANSYSANTLRPLNRLNVMSDLHREDGPAIKGKDSKEWYFNGVRHRIGGPARIWYGFAKWWYVEGKLHREDGPAAIDNKGRKAWYLNNNQLTFDEWCQELNKTDEEIATLVLKWA